MRRDLNTFTKRGFQHAATLTALVLPLFFAGQALAAKAGHGRVTSAPGQALQISLPLLELNTQDQAVLQVKVAAAPLWSQAGLTPPVSLDSLTVTLKPGQNPESREIVISSNQQITQSPVDILLEVVTATGSTQIQSSYLVLLPAQITQSGKSPSAASLRVSPGDTLFGIAQRHLVPGVDMYQMLQAIYEANPKAFIAGNMNLLRAGAVLNIPDGDVIRAIDKDIARSTYQKHLNAFTQRRAATSGRNTPLVAGNSTQSGVVSAVPVQEAPAEKTDHLKLSAPNSADQRADAKVSAAKEIEELQSRIQALQQNVKQLKESLGDVTDQSVSTAPSTLGETVSPVVTPAAAVVNEQSPAVPTNASKDTGSQESQQSSANVWNDLSGFLAKNILAALTALIALSALVIAWMLRRAGVRKDDDAEELDAVMQTNPAVQSAFDKKLQSISLDLDDDSEVVSQKAPSVRQPL
jgi:pilus assembly protein FimV